MKIIALTAFLALFVYADTQSDSHSDSYSDSHSHHCPSICELSEKCLLGQCVPKCPAKCKGEFNVCYQGTDFKCQPKVCNPHQKVNVSCGKVMQKLGCAPGYVVDCGQPLPLMKKNVCYCKKVVCPPVSSCTRDQFCDPLRGKGICQPLTAKTCSTTLDCQALAPLSICPSNNLVCSIPKCICKTCPTNCSQDQYCKPSEGTFICTNLGTISCSSDTYCQNNYQTFASCERPLKCSGSSKCTCPPPQTCPNNCTQDQYCNPQEATFVCTPLGKRSCSNSQQCQTLYQGFGNCERPLICSINNKCACPPPKICPTNCTQDQYCNPQGGTFACTNLAAAGLCGGSDTACQANLQLFTSCPRLLKCSGSNQCYCPPPNCPNNCSRDQYCNPSEETFVCAGLGIKSCSDDAECQVNYQGFTNCQQNLRCSGSNKCYCPRCPSNCTPNQYCRPSEGTFVCTDLSTQSCATDAYCQNVFQVYTTCPNQLTCTGMISSTCTCPPSP